MSSKKNILFLAPYPKGYGPSQRFRLEIYLNQLESHNIPYDYEIFYNEKAYRILYQKGKVLQKLLLILSGFWKRFLLLFSLGQYSHVFIHRELTPIGPPIFEWIISKVFKKKVIYDFDDAIWLPNYSENNAFFSRFKNYKKVNKIMKWSDVVVAGNAYLQSHGEQYNPNTIIIPTVVDTAHYHQPAKDHKSKTMTLGWTGTLTTNIHLESLKDVFKRLSKKHDFRLKIISNQRPALDLPNVVYENWDRSREIEQLQDIDIGLMPLLSNKDFYKGKCGFKAIQFMALEKVTVASPVGVNREIIQDGVNGFLAETNEDWHHILDELLTDLHKYDAMAQNGRKTIEKKYSLKANTQLFISLFD